MYRLQNPDEKVVENYYIDNYNAINTWVDRFLSGEVINLQLRNAAKTMLTVRVHPGSITERFLRYLQRPIVIHWLMTCRPENLLCCIKRVNGLVGDSKDRELSKLDTNLWRKYYEPNTDIDHFLTIVSEIFVNKVFNGKVNNIPVFNKSKFCRERGVVICPYCGVEDITTHEVYRKNGKTYVKPDIDHFLPKSLYPYLAMSFYNLIPCGGECNLGRKGTMDPIVDLVGNQYRIMNPYLFRKEAFDFYYDMNQADYLKDTAYEVKINFYGDGELENGYSNKLGLIALYQEKRFMLVDIYKMMSGFSDDYLRLNRNMGIELGQPDLVRVLGYDLNEENSRKYACYKFRLDMAGKMREDSGCRWPW